LKQITEWALKSYNKLSNRWHSVDWQGVVQSQCPMNDFHRFLLLQGRTHAEREKERKNSSTTITRWGDSTKDSRFQGEFHRKQKTIPPLACSCAPYPMYQQGYLLPFFFFLSSFTVEWSNNQRVKKKQLGFLREPRHHVLRETRKCQE